MNTNQLLKILSGIKSKIEKDKSLNDEYDDQAAAGDRRELLNEIEKEIVNIQKTYHSEEYEQSVLRDIFGENKLWKDKYLIDWCEHCGCVVINCNKCNNSSCNCGSCDDCRADFKEFTSTVKTTVECYLNEDEKKVAEKIFFLKKYILDSVGEQEKEIDWDKLSERGEMCDRAHELFGIETHPKWRQECKLINNDEI